MKASLNSLHHQTGDWLRELDFYKQEISLLKKRLEEVVTQNSAQEILAQVEHFQNKFIVEAEQLDILRHDVNKENQTINERIKDLPEHAHEKFNLVHEKTQERMKTYATGFANLRFEFNKFLSKVM